MKEDQREQSEQSSDQVKFCKYDYWVDSGIVLSFRRINHMALKTICIDPLSICYWTSHHEHVQYFQTSPITLCHLRTVWHHSVSTGLGINLLLLNLQPPGFKFTEHRLGTYLVRNVYFQYIFTKVCLAARYRQPVLFVNCKPNSRQSHRDPSNSGIHGIYTSKHW
jgi:hypothetical protein